MTLSHWGRPVAIVAALLSLAACEKSLPRGGLSQLEAPARLPEPRGTYLDLGRQLLRTGDVRLARGAFIRSIRVEGLSAEALTGAGITAEREGLLTEARRFFERARARAPNSVIAHNNLGAVLYRLGTYNEAKRAFQTAFALSSGNSRIAHHNLGLTEMALREAEAATVPMARNPMPLQREGTGEYRLLEKEEDGQET